MTKISLGKKIVSLINAVAHGVRPKRFECKFMAPGLTNYPGENGKGEEMWYLSRDVMTKMQDTFVGCPVVVQEKHDGDSTPDRFKDVAVGVITDVETKEDGWDWCKFIVWEDETIRKIEENGWNVSCAYNTVQDLPGGVLNAINYDHEVGEGEYIHLAIVESPRQTGARILLNSLDREKCGAILMFNMNGKKYRLFTNGRTKSVKNNDDSEKELAELEKRLQTATGKEAEKIQDQIDKLLFTNGKNNASDLIQKVKVAVDAGKDLTEVDQIFEQITDLREREEAMDYIVKHYKGSGGWEELRKTFGNKGGNKMNWLKELLVKLNAEEKEIGKKYNLDEAITKLDEEPEIDPEKAVIETPDGDVSLKDMVSAYEGSKDKENEDDDKDKDKKNKLNMNSKFKGVLVSEMYSAWKKAKKNEETPEEKKAREDAEAKKNAEDEKNERVEALKSEGKTEDEINAILQSEEDEKKKLDEENALKNAEAEAEKAEKEADEKTNHFNSLASARNKGIDDKPGPVIMTRRQRIDAAKNQY